MPRRTDGALRFIALAAAAAWLCACAPPLRGMAEALMSAHNAYRSAAGLSPLTWSESLACDAQRWATVLVASSPVTLRHATPAVRNKAGENLWLGTAGRFSWTEMVDSWGEEKIFYPGGPIDPDTAHAFGHYTQIVWRGTRSVGCGFAPGGPDDVLVCRYDPPGNVVGQPPF